MSLDTKIGRKKRENLKSLMRFMKQQRCGLLSRVGVKPPSYSPL
jgi:hypothetical protein